MEATAVDEEAQTAGVKNVDNPKVPMPTWWNHLSESSNATYIICSTVLGFLLSQNASGEELDNISTIILCLALFSAYLLAFILICFRIVASPKDKDQNNIKHKNQIIIMWLNLLIESVLGGINSLFLCIVHKSYLGFILIQVLVLIIAAILFHSNLKLDKNQGGTEDDDSMVKSCFKVGNAATNVGYLVQTAVCIGYIKYPNFRKKFPDQCTLIFGFFTSSMGSFARTISSSPLQFHSKPMSCTLKLITYCVLVLPGFTLVFLSAEFLDATKIVFTLYIAVCTIFVDNQWQKNMNQKPNEDNSTSTGSGEEVDSAFGKLVGFCAFVLCANYAVKFIEGHTSPYLTWSVFFLLLSTISSLMRGMPFFSLSPFPAVLWLTMVEGLVGLALLLKEYSAYISKVSWKS